MKQNKNKTKNKDPQFPQRSALDKCLSQYFPFPLLPCIPEQLIFFSFTPVTTQRTKIIMEYFTLQMAQQQRVIAAPTASHFRFHPEGLSQQPLCNVRQKDNWKKSNKQRKNISHNLFLQESSPLKRNSAFIEFLSLVCEYINFYFFPASSIHQ